MVSSNYEREGKILEDCARRAGLVLDHQRALDNVALGISFIPLDGGAGFMVALDRYCKLFKPAAWNDRDRYANHGLRRHPRKPPPRITCSTYLFPAEYGPAVKVAERYLKAGMPASRVQRMLENSGSKVTCFPQPFSIEIVIPTRGA